MLRGMLRPGQTLLWAPYPGLPDVTEELTVRQREIDPQTGVVWWNLENERCQFPLPEHRIRALCWWPTASRGVQDLDEPVQEQDASSPVWPIAHRPTQLSLFASL